MQRLLFFAFGGENAAVCSVKQSFDSVESAPEGQNDELFVKKQPMFSVFWIAPGTGM